MAIPAGLGTLATDQFAVDEAYEAYSTKFYGLKEYPIFATHDPLFSFCCITVLFIQCPPNLNMILLIAAVVQAAVSTSFTDFRGHSARELMNRTEGVLMFTQQRVV